MKYGQRVGDTERGKKSAPRARDDESGSETTFRIDVLGSRGTFI